MNFHTLSCKKLSTSIIPIFFKTIFKRGFSNEDTGFLGRGIDFDILWGHFYCDEGKIHFTRIIRVQVRTPKLGRRKCVFYFLTIIVPPVKVAPL